VPSLDCDLLRSSPERASDLFDIQVMVGKEVTDKSVYILEVLLAMYADWHEIQMVF
jgi:hypothetical protein